MRESKKIWLYVFAGVLGFGFLWYLLLMPVKLCIEIVPDTLYLDESLKPGDFDVFYKSVLGVKVHAKDFYYKQADGALYVAAKHLNHKSKLDCETPDSHEFVYDTKVYAGQVIDQEKFHVRSVYGDTVRETRDFRMSGDVVPLSKKINCQILLNSGIEEWEADVVVPEKIKAKYKKTPKLGDLFDKSQVIVKLQYPDGTSAKLDDFTIKEPPVYLTGKLKLDITTDYGDTSLWIKPQNFQPLTGAYNNTVYVGDTLDDSLFTLSMTDADGNPVLIDDFTVDNPGQIKTVTDVTLHSKFGDATVRVEPIRVESCMGDPDGELVEGQTPNFKVLHLYYADGQVRDIDPGDVEFTNLESINKAGLNTIYFIYNGVYYWFEQQLLPENIVNLRKTGGDVPDIGTTYELNNAQINALAIVAQRLADEDLTVAGAELSLMANRYEIYSSDRSQDGAYLVKYVTESGYWGRDLGDYLYGQEPSSDMQYLVRDVLVNGHRTLPLYIDERAGTTDIKEMNSSQYEENQTVITKLDDTEFRFFAFPSDDTQIAYGYTDFGYESIKQADVPASNPKTKIMKVEEDDGIIIQMDDYGDLLEDSRAGDDGLVVDEHNESVRAR